jgi:hypothetical protein
MRMVLAPRLSAGLALALVAGAAQAQDAGPLYGSVRDPGTRGLGAAVSGAIGNAANAVAQSNAATGAAAPRGDSAPSRGPSRIAVTQFYSLPKNDALEGTDAPRYALGNGRTMRASGTFTLAGAAGSESLCVLRYGAVRASGGYHPSGPPLDDCLNFGA